MSVTIRYTDDDRPFPGCVIVPGPDWERDAAYYLTLPGYRLVEVFCSVLCVKCKGHGRIRTRRTGPLYGYKDCRQCLGRGEIARVPLQFSALSASDYRPY